MKSFRFILTLFGNSYIFQVNERFSVFR